MVVSASAAIARLVLVAGLTCRRGEELMCEASVRVTFISQGRAKPIPKPLRIAMKADQDSAGA